MVSRRQGGRRDLERERGREGERARARGRANALLCEVCEVRAGDGATPLQRSLNAKDLCNVNHDAFLRITLLAEKRGELRYRTPSNGAGE